MDRIIYLVYPVILSKFSPLFYPLHWNATAVRHCLWLFIKLDDMLSSIFILYRLFLLFSPTTIAHIVSPPYFSMNALG
jgi:hypothetical protein